MNQKLLNSENKITVHTIYPVNLFHMDLQGIYFQLFNDNLVDFINSFFYLGHTTLCENKREIMIL